MIELALYHPEHGFYARDRGAGRARDFLTSPELGGLFGAVFARALDEWWEELRRPDPYVVIEAGAGTGTLAAAILSAAPACASALRYVLVERSPAARARQAERLSLEPASQVLGPVVTADPDIGPAPVAGSGPLLTSLGEMPAGPVDGVVFANELLDNLPFRLLRRSTAGSPWRWDEVRVRPDLDEVLVPSPPDATADADRLAPDAPEDGRIPLQYEAASWLRAALACLARGRVVVVDYTDVTPHLATRPWSEWVRTYRAHGPGGHPLEALGEQDVTCEVAVDQLAGVRTPTEHRSQAEFLVAHGIAEFTQQARDRWRVGAAAPDVATLSARSRVGESAALTDPMGLGAFSVLEWAVR